MWAEAIARAFWPFWTVLITGIAPLLMGWHDLVPVEPLWSLAALYGLALIWTLVLGLRRMHRPRRADAVDRVDAKLRGRPIAALADTQAIGVGDPDSEAVWQAHLRRMQARTHEAKFVEPNLRISQLDQFGLRYVALLLLVVAGIFGSLGNVSSVGRMAGGGGQTLLTGPVWEGWVEPPSYTGKPTLYLADIPEGALRVPVGSSVTLRLYGELGALSVVQSVSGPVADPVTDPVQEFSIARDGALTIDGDGGLTWQVTALPDVVPTVDLTGPLEASALGELSQPFEAMDDYGVQAGTAEFQLDLSRVDRRHGLVVPPDERPAVILDLPMPFSGDRADFDELLIDDLSEHPYANLPAVLMLTVTDALGQEGVSQAEPVAVLPARRFFQPVAKAVAEQRRDLLWSRENGTRVLQILRAVSHRPDDLFADETTYLRLSFALRRLSGMLDEGLTVADQDEIAAALWELAIQLEDGSLADARERLRRAQERLAEAMRNGASDEEIEELVQELREAVDDYTRMLAERSGEDQQLSDQPDQEDDDRFNFTNEELQALMDRIQELMEEGRMAEAQELMEQLNDLMENMEVTENEGGEPTPGQDSMEGLSDALRDQQSLSDDSFQELQNQFNSSRNSDAPQQNQSGQQGQRADRPGEQGRDGQGEGVGSNPDMGKQNDQGAGGEADPDSLADRQEALRRELQRQYDGLPNIEGPAADAARQALERAEEAMDQAEESLRSGDLAEAIDEQAEALDALRDGLRNLSDALAQEQRQRGGQGTDSGNAQGRVEQSDRDPLGREAGTTGQFGTDQDVLQGPDVYRRAQELLEELRKRSADQDRPELERDYIDRLLDRF